MNILLNIFIGFWVVLAFIRWALFFFINFMTNKKEYLVWQKHIAKIDPDRNLATYERLCEPPTLVSLIATGLLAIGVLI